MARLILHVGTHKTATTRIQNLFRRNRALLARHGVIYPQIGRWRTHHPLVGLWNARLLPQRGFDPRAAWTDLVARQARGSQTVLLSSEEFSRISPGRVDMAELAALTAPFEEVQILCSLRNQAWFLQSVYLEILKRNPIPDWDDFLATALRTHLADGLSLQYGRLYSHLLTGFAPGQIRLISYDAALHEEDGIVGTVLRALGLPLRLADLAPIAAYRSNISAPPLAAHLAAGLSRPAPPWPAAIRQVQRRIEAQFGPGRRSTLLSRAEQARITETFAKSNIDLARRVAPYQPDFHLPAPATAAITLWRDDLPPDFQREIAITRPLSSHLGRIWQQVRTRRPQ